MCIQLRILYDTSYATRGNSGIPGDSRSLAAILNSNFKDNCHFLFIPRGYVRRFFVTNPSTTTLSTYLAKAIKPNGSRTILPIRVERILIIAQALNPISIVRKIRISEVLSKNALANLGIRHGIPIMYIALIANASRFARPYILGNYRLNTKKYNIFIQQQIDPIKVSRGTRHIIRLHDILPITNPQYFDDIAVYAFSNGLQKSLKNKKIEWVMDTNASVQEFKRLFGENLKVSSIPCAVGTQFELSNTNWKKHNQILVVNTLEPRKQTRRIIDSFIFGQNSGLIPKTYKLVIMGGEGWQENSLIKDLQDEVFGKSISFIYKPSDSRIQIEMQKSKFIVSASAAEGFGLPPLEGMLFGCFPIVSSIPQHKETIGKFGHYFDPLGSDLPGILGKAIIKNGKATKETQLQLRNYVLSNFSIKVVEKEWLKLLNL